MKKFVVNTYEIKQKKTGLPSGFLRFAFLTDYHNASDGADHDRILAAIREMEPDAILCGGDMIVGKPDHSVDPARRLMLALADRYPVFHGTGNHEYRTRIYPETYPGMYEAYRRPLEEAGVIFLENTCARIQIRQLPVTIYGFDMDRFYYHRFKRRRLPLQEMEDSLGEVDGQGVSILLAHNPAQMDTYLAWGADLTLCGHYHGGIMGLGEHRGLISPDFRLFPANAHGLFRKNDSFLLVGAGLGEHTLPLRIHNPRELIEVKVNIRGADEEGEITDGDSGEASGL